jgi:3'-(hydroxy)phthioceranyl-2'-palmitoyl(stearoyl)-2-O-sulfo-trehalose (hydroxy)phthioceranyltransferase
MLIAVVIAAFGIGSVPALARAENALSLGGTPIPSYLGWFVETPRYPRNPQYFAPYTFTSVPYPQTIGPFSGIGTPTMGQSVATGMAHLHAAIYAADWPLLVVGNSQGSLPTDAVRAQLEKDPNPPPRGQLSFLVNGDPEQRGGLFNVLFAPGTYLPIFDYTVLGVVESRFDTVVFTYEYDGIADFPDRPWNLLADLNALFGVAYRHAATGSLDPYAIPDEDITITTNSQGAKTTTYLGRAEHLPLTEPLRRLGVSADLVDAIDRVLRPIVDRGYSRNDSGPFRAPIMSGGLLHWPVPRPATAVQQPSADAVSPAVGTPDPSARADHDRPKSSRAALEPEKQPKKKKRPALNVIRNTLTTTKPEAGHQVGARPRNAKGQGQAAVKADPPSTSSTPSADSAESGVTEPTQDHETP